MNELATPSPYTPAGGSNMTIGNPPVLGSQVPGTTGGLPSLGGLSVMQNPIAQDFQSSQSTQPMQAAQHAQQFGRGQDTMLVHMTPEEVNSLQGLAMASGGSLTINPHTGLPEAGWLGKLLPSIIGLAGAAFGLPTWALVGGTTLGQTAITGDLRKGIMAGLGAWGGASLAGGLGIGEAGKKVGEEVAKQTAQAGVEKAAVETAKQGLATAGTDVAKAAAQKTLDEALKNQVTKVPGLLDKLQMGSRVGMPGGIIAKAAPYAAGMGLLNTVSEATAPNIPTYKPEQTKPYVRMAPAKREVRYPTQEELARLGSAEFNYFTPSNPDPVPLDTQQGMSTGYGFADGGAVQGNAGLDALIASYGAQNPGAITASMYPIPFTPPAPAAPAPASTASNASSGLGTFTTTPSATGGEPTYNFNRKPMGTGASGTGTGFGGFNFGGMNFGNIDWSNILQNANNAAAAPNATEPTTPNYDYSNIDYSQYSPDYGQYTPTPQAPALEPVTPSVDYSQFTPSFDYNQYTADMPMQQEAAPSFDYSQFYTPAAPQVTMPAQEAAPAFEYPQFSSDFNSYGGNQFGMYDNLGLFARGGTVDMRDGSFVVDARTVSELGNGSSNAGMEML